MPLLFSLRSARFPHGWFGVIGRLLVDRTASTSVEFALILFPFVSLIGASIDVGWAYFRMAQLQATTQYASRYILANALPPGETWTSFVRSKVCTWQTTGKVAPHTLNTMFDCNRVMIDIRTPANWSSANLANDWVSGVYDNPIPVPAPGQIVVLRIIYQQKTFFRFLKWIPIARFYDENDEGGQIVVNDSLNLMGVVAFRVEPKWS